MTTAPQNPRSPHLAALLAVAGCLAFALWLGLRGPETPIPMHFAADGTVDRWGDRREAAWVLGAVTVFLAAAYGLTAHSIRKSAGSVQRGLALVQAVLIGTMVCLASLIGGMAYGVFTEGGQLHRQLGVFISAIMLLIGAVLGKVPPNPWVGVRTYWALTSRLAWDKSNRLMGRLALWGGLIGLPLALLGPQPLANGAILGLLGMAALAAVIESWRVWNADPERRTA